MAAEETEGVLMICKLETYNMREFIQYFFAILDILLYFMCMFSNMLYNGWCYEIEKSHCKEEILFSNFAIPHYSTV